MQIFDFSFDRPVNRMTFSCANGEIAAQLYDDQKREEEMQQKQQVELVSKIVNTINQQFARLQKELNELKPMLLSAAIEFVESFVALMFECDEEMLKEKIASNIKLAMSSMEIDSVVIIHLNPETLVKFGPTIQKEVATEIQIQADPLLDVADCRIEADRQEQIARLRRQLELARNHWLEKQCP